MKVSNLKVRACYSRELEKARNFINNLNIKARPVSSFEELIDEVDAIYIASPNGLHYQQAKYFLSQQKHVFLEKPLTLDYLQAKELEKIAQINNVILMEAFKIIHLPQFQLLDDFVNEYNPVLSNLVLNQYSSRMDDVKNGIFKSVFDEKLGKGSTYDMLVYPVELSIALFGPIEEVKSMGIKLPNGVTITDIVNIKHTNGELTNIVCSKALKNYGPTPKNVVKVILENCLLTKDEIVKCCNLAIEAGLEFVKTSTGFSTSGATFEDVKLMKDTVRTKALVKAAGGVRSREDAIKMIENGADRLVGCGMVGNSFLYSAINRGIAQHYVLIDAFPQAAEGNALDMLDASAVADHIFSSIKAGDYNDCKDADLVVITAGRPQKEGETRLEMVADNARIMKDIALKIKASGFNGITLIASNPVDVLTTVYQEVTGYPENKVISSGTTLDSARLRRLVGNKLGIAPANVNAFVLVMQKTIEELIEAGRLKREDLDEMHKEMVNMAYTIINLKRATYYGVGVCLATLAKAILNDEKSTFLVGAKLNGQYNVKDTYIGVPVVLGANGIERIIE
ncbi:hypothetical protein FQR65_LT18574 [Abscondita terminalis]|nr:hypothetical protein FQR65_LT18574 [Abscondita terminalis]